MWALRNKDLCLCRATHLWVKDIGICPVAWWMAPTPYKIDISFYDSLELHRVLLVVFCKGLD